MANLKEQIIRARMLTVPDMLALGFSFDELRENGEVEYEYYPASETYEYYDGEHYYNKFGDRLRNPREYQPNTEGYTPFGDE